ncbi:ABC transporter substrate-binding protein [Schlesneria paludicola]|uniref:ABC transporter substrate-binding protein n=1 Tax=Schlesneria paludicola TaxID=360056 RepID=UPI00029ADB03|nr:ABC transporter substrate-binding protein [Schlesneria paludicola]
MRHRVFASVLILLFCACLTGWWISRSSTPLPPPTTSSRQVIDLAGRQVLIPEQVNRFVLMRGMGLYDVAVLLGEETPQKLVGWDSSLKSSDRDAYEKFVERFPRLAEVPMLGDTLRKGVSAESILALQPDLVIGGTYMIGQTECLEQVAQAGVPVLYLSSDDPFHDPQQSLALLGEVFGMQQRAQEMIEWVNREMNVVQDRLSRLDGPIPSIYVEAGNFGPGKYGNTFGCNLQKQRMNWGSILAQIRCQNVAEDLSGPYGMAVIQPEYLLARNPDVVVITGACWEAFPESLHLGYAADPEKARSNLRDYQARPGWSELNAVRDGRVYGLNTRLGSHIMSFAAVQQLAKWLYPSQFQDLDPRQRLQEFHEKYMPIGFSGTWMVELKDR